jgi:galliderm_ABC: lantibiotic protection ABC transporter, ATP-binding subunit
MELSINNVTKQFKDKKAVNDISFSMGNGVYGLLGVNGAGKTNVDENVMYTDNTRLWNDHMGWKRYL